MKIIVIGATGTIGSAIVKALEGRHEIIPASRKSGYRADIDDAASLAALFATVGSFDAVVCAAGSASYKPFADLQPADFAVGFNSKFMGQVNLARLAIPHLVDGGSITLTSGVWGIEPPPNAGAISPMNAAIDGFVRAAAVELPRGLRINSVSPPLIGEPVWENGRVKVMSAADMAHAYVEVIEGSSSGAVIDTRPYAKR